MDQRFAWSFLGFLIGAFFGILTVYTEFIRDDTPSITLTTLSDASVLNVNENISDLGITYRGQDIHSAGLSLRVVVLQLENDGNATILPSHFDSSYPFGFELIGGEIVRLEVLDGSSEYLQNASIKQTTKTDVLITPCILESNEWIRVKTIILHPKEKMPNFSSTGKIANVKNIDIINSASTQDDEGLLTKSFGGNLLVQFLRGIGYFFGTFFSIFLLMLLIALPTEYLTRRRRKKIVREFRESNPATQNSSYDSIFNSFILDGIHQLNIIAWQLKDYLRLLREQSRKKESDDLHRGSDDSESIDSMARRHPFHSLRLDWLEKKGFMFRENGNWNVDESQLKVLGDFLNWVSARN
ncbi:hypothetical protein [Bremerella volcania]|nr:hypothetical protein [Bremerella volcania]